MTHIIIFLENIESSDDTIAVTSLADATLKKIILSQNATKMWHCWILNVVTPGLWLLPKKFNRKIITSGHRIHHLKVYCGTSYMQRKKDSNAATFMLCLGFSRMTPTPTPPFCSNISRTNRDSAKTFLRVGIDVIRALWAKFGEINNTDISHLSELYKKITLQDVRTNCYCAFRVILCVHFSLIPVQYCVLIWGQILSQCFCTTI